MRKYYAKVKLNYSNHQQPINQAKYTCTASGRQQAIQQIEQRLNELPPYVSYQIITLSENPFELFNYRAMLRGEYHNGKMSPVPIIVKAESATEASNLAKEVASRIKEIKSFEIGPPHLVSESEPENASLFSKMF
ncbi:hypothetical protein [Gaoshiqia sediminis]|uniref:Uncharacterized protein n=1 Tax=Gaoshiqia sediminis TaxID=2986998 RepID=A0AA41Y7X0_9BACT|nr:hypothetical protein [Gaoshiqia sediminis]MCW0483495.1 hypothetical protein [Gaoshiqia sediminis]